MPISDIFGQHEPYAKGTPDTKCALRYWRHTSGRSQRDRRLPPSRYRQPHIAYSVCTRALATVDWLQRADRTGTLVHQLYGWALICNILTEMDISAPSLTGTSVDIFIPGDDDIVGLVGLCRARPAPCFRLTATRVSGGLNGVGQLARGNGMRANLRWTMRF